MIRNEGQQDLQKDLELCFGPHIQAVCARTAHALASCGHTGLLIYAGAPLPVFEDDRTFRAGNFHAARIAGICSCGGVKYPRGAVGEFQGGESRVLGFDFVQESGRMSLNTSHVAEQKQQLADEHAEWADELKQLRRILDKQGAGIGGKAPRVEA